MQCKKCREQLSEKINFCQNCGSKVELTKENKNVPWYQKIKWWGLLIISLISYIIYYPDGGYLWYFLFLIGFIFSLIQFIKEDYFKLNYRSNSSRQFLKILVSVGYISIFFLLPAYLLWL